MSWIALGLIAALGGAGVAVLGKVGLEGIDPTLATTVRSAVMTGVLILTTIATGHLRSFVDSASQLGTRAWLFIVLAGLSGAVSWLAYFAALKLGTATQVASIDRLSLVFVVILSVLLLGERVSARGWLGVAFVVLGVILVATQPTAG